MYNVTPFPDFDDEEQVQRYIQDRRVIGVSSYSDRLYRFFCSITPGSMILWFNLLYFAMISSLLQTQRERLRLPATLLRVS